MKNYKDISFFKFRLGLLLFLSFSVYSYAQDLNGPSPVYTGDTESYIYNDGLSKPTHSWDIVGGTLVSSSSSGTTYTAVVQWTTVGSGGVTFKGKYGDILETLIVTVQQGANPPTFVSDLNYVHNITPRIPTTDITTLNTDEKIESITYFDGLGRAAQQVGIRAGGNSEDIITHIGYDEFGRQVKDYLPYSSPANIGSYRPDALAATHTYYDTSSYEDDFLGMTTTDINPYSEKEFDNSPLNRVMKQAAPGKDWKLGNGHEIEMDYLTNTFNPSSPTNSSNDNVRLYKVSLSFANNTYTPTLVLNTGNAGYYAANELYKTITRDENHDGTATKAHTTEEFKDKQGRVILKRTYGTSKVNGVTLTNAPHDTYYVYDDYGNLIYVLPPKSEPQSAKPDSVELSELCYQYKYDDLNRLVEKKIPGKGWEYIVYNKLDQPIMTQDQNLKVQNKWLFTKYDVFGRVAYTGFRSSSASRITFQGIVNNETTMHVSKVSSPTTLAGTAIYYNNASYPTTNISDILTINYYDNYTFDKVSGNSETAYGVTPITNVKGLATGSKVRVLGTSHWITTVTYYDDKSRPIYVYSNNPFLGTTDKVKTKYSFDGRVLETTTTHAKTGKSTITIVDKYEYDHSNRLKKHSQKINNAALDEVIAENVYDDLGQLIAKNVGGKTNQSRLQDINYEYNVRGWLKTINDPSILGNDLFAFKLNYNSIEVSGSTHLYNGNISESIWYTKNDLDDYNTIKSRAYSYKYDALNRIIQANFRVKNSSGTYNMLNYGNYDLKSVSYDKNGNIQTLKRAGDYYSAEIDNLTYTYDSGNKLIKVVDNGSTYNNMKDEGFKDVNNSGNDYIYDSNGNMIYDLNKSMSSYMTYNHLNLPTYIPISGGAIQYIYDATGVKLKKIVSTGTNTEYAGNFIYENGNLQFFSHPEGYVDADLSYKYPTFDYVYQYKDHLGNIRLSYKNISTKGGSILEIIEENNYYPFGLKHKGYNDVVSANVNSIAQKFKYNGIELEESLGMNLYEMEWRQYDPAIARFTSIDPVTHFSQSTYNGFDNNPIYWADPSGADAESFIMDLFNRSSSGEKWTNNNGTFSSSNGQTADCDECKEGTSKQFKQFHPKTTGKFIRKTKYYHSGGLGDKGWYSGNDYLELYRDTVRDIATGKASMESIPLADMPENMRNALISWIIQATDYYSTHYTPEEMMAYGNITPMGIDSPFFGTGVLRYLTKGLTLKSTVSSAIGKGYKPVASMSVAIKNQDVLKALNKTQQGNWVKIYQAGYLNKKKVEVHFFINKKTGSMFDIKIKRNGSWSKSNFGKGKNKITE
jgi:RHS repeat-associated protein